MSIMVTNRDINALHPVAQKACRLFLDECEKQGVDIFIAETYRSQERQNWLYAQGRTRPGQIVTWTLNSNHKSKLAWDIAVSPPKNLYDVATLNRAGAIARNLGIEWGGDWKGTIDRPHFQVKTSWSVPSQIASNNIKELQRLLNQVGYQLDVDGSHGPVTTNAVKDFQKKYGLKVDGSAGPITMAKLKSIIKNNKEEKEGDIMSQPFKPTSHAISKAVQDVIYSQSKKEWGKNTPYLSDEWRKKYLAGDMTISDAIGLLYVMIDRGAIELGNKDAKPID